MSVDRLTGWFLLWPLRVAWCAGLVLGTGVCGPSVGIESLPTPWCIAHRGGPLLWPEATMEAYEAAVAAGNHFVEVDCFYLTDGTLGVMHDSTLDRTTTSKGKTEALSGRKWRELVVNIGNSLGPEWANLRAPFFDEVLVRFGNRQIIFAEAKNAGSGRAIVAKLKEYHISRDYVVVDSFMPEELRPARSAGYLVSWNLPKDSPVTPAQVVKSRFWSVSVPYAVTEAYIRSFKEAGIKVMVYTINRQSDRDRLLAWGADGFYTDDPLYLDPMATYARNDDPFSLRRWHPGMIAAQEGGRGYFAPPDRWGIDASQENVYKGCLQGWLSPRKRNQVAANWTLDLSVTFRERCEEGRWASVALMTTDAPLQSDTNPPQLYGYNILFHNTGGLAVFRYDGEAGKSPTQLAEFGGPAIAFGATVKYRIEVTPSNVVVQRVGTDVRISVNDAKYRGGYFTFGAKGQRAEFSAVRLHAP